jgi:hypothetical protein
MLSRMAPRSGSGITWRITSSARRAKCASVSSMRVPAGALTCRAELARVDLGEEVAADQGQREGRGEQTGAERR